MAIVRSFGDHDRIAELALPFLEESIWRDGEPNRYHALHATHRLGPAAIPLWIRVMDHEDGRVRLDACYQLSRIDDPGEEVLAALRKAQEDEYNHVRTTARRALASARAPR